MYDISVFDNFDKLKIDVGSEGLYEKIDVGSAN